MTKMITIGSLFDGISGFPLAGQRNGMTALWASEIEPFPIKVSAIRFPGMKQMGDITKIDCDELETVDIITGGSPCQDLSVAGKRAGLAGERSGLFMEQIRIVREMRYADKRNGKAGEFIRPRFMVWENVPGAFSSNKGEDFRAVLEETARIADETIVIPRPPKGKWNTAGCIMGNGYSIAWRVLDAQYWGVPQRRRRIYLVADFGGQSAPQILFKRTGLSRHLAESGEAREGIAADAERSIGETSTFDFGRTSDRIEINPSVAVTLKGTGGGGGAKTGLYCIQGNCIDRADTARCNGRGWTEDVCYTLNTIDRPAVCAGFCYKAAAAAGSVGYEEGKSPTLKAQQQMAVINCQPSGIAGTVSSKWAKGTGGPAGDECYNLVCSVDCRNGVENSNISGTLQNNGNSLNALNPVRQGYSVRRLTPLECERLQDYPDNWTDIPGASDSARYKALGNSVAVCCPEYVLEGIKEAMTDET